MHVNVIMDGQLDKHLLFRQRAISVILYFALYIVLLFEMQIMMIMMVMYSLSSSSICHTASNADNHASEICSILHPLQCGMHTTGVPIHKRILGARH